MDTICNRQTQSAPEGYPVTDGEPRTGNAGVVRPQATRIHTRPEPVRFHNGRRRRHDWLWNLHRSSRDGPSYRQRRLAASGVGRRRRPHNLRSALLRRTLGDDAASGRHVCLPARSVLAVVGISLRLDVILRDRDGDDRGGGGSLRPLFWSALAADLRRQVSHRAGSPLNSLRVVIVDGSVAGDLRHRAADLRQYAGTSLWQVDPECVHRCQDRSAGWPDHFRDFCWAQHFGSAWHAQGVDSLGGGLTAATLSGLVVAICLSQTGSLFSADSWHNIAFAAGEVKRPERNVTLAMVIGATTVIVLYLLANVAYLVTLPLEAIQHAPADRVGTATLQAIFPGIGTVVMAAAIMVSTFGTINALTLTGARVYYAMARQRLFFPFAGKLNSARVPASSLRLQGLWAAALVLPRTYDPATQSWGNLYSNLLEYVISAALIFYVLTVAGVFRLRVTRPDAPRPYRTIGYPVVPGLYILMASTILAVLFAYRPATTWPGLLIVLLGIPIYLVIGWADRGRGAELSQPRDTE